MSDASGHAERAENEALGVIDRTATDASLRTIAMPADTNPNGDIFGGWILSQMDLAGGTHAFHEAGGRVATVAVTGMKFHKPVVVGDEVSCYCSTERVGRTSIEVRVETWVRRRHGAAEEQVTEGRFTFVAIDDGGRPRPVDEPVPHSGTHDSGTRTA